MNATAGVAKCARRRAWVVRAVVRGVINDARTMAEGAERVNAVAQGERDRRRRGGVS